MGLSSCLCVLLGLSLWKKQNRPDKYPLLSLSLPCAAVRAAMQACATLVAPMMVRLPHVVPVVHLVVCVGAALGCGK
jgi:hypothetical protein